MADYRLHRPVDPHADELHPLLTKVIQVLVDEQLQATRIPAFWTEHATEYGLDLKRTLRPRWWTLPVSLLLTISALAPFYGVLWADWNAPLLVLAGYALAGVLYVNGVILKTLRLRKTTWDLAIAHATASRWVAAHYLPFFNVYCGGKEAYAAFVRRMRGERPSDDALLYAILKDGQEKIIDPLRERLDVACARYASADHPLAMAASMAFKQCERAFKDYDEALTAMDPTYLYTAQEQHPLLREALRMSFLLACSAIEAAEEGSTGLRTDEETVDELNAPTVLAGSVLHRR